VTTPNPPPRREAPEQLPVVCGVDASQLAVGGHQLDRPDAVGRDPGLAAVEADPATQQVPDSADERRRVSSSTPPSMRVLISSAPRIGHTVAAPWPVLCTRTGRHSVLAVAIAERTPATVVAVTATTLATPGISCRADRTGQHARRTTRRTP
jgi:hypothetical protein